MRTLLAEAYLHQLDPFAVQFTENQGIRWYGLSYMLGFVVGWLLIKWLARSRRSTLPPEGVGDFLFYAIIGVIAGGRLGYCIFYQPDLFWDPPIIGVFFVWNGGMASHGGIVGVILACCFFARRRGLSAFHLMDITAFTCTPGLGFGRLANFVNAELWGKPLAKAMQSDPPWWSVKYAQEIFLPDFPHGDALEKLRRLVPNGEAFRQSLVDAVQNGNQEVIGALRPLLTAYYPSQIFQALSDGLCLFTLVGLAWLWPRKPGVIAGWFLASYGVLRITTEVFRQPDQGVSLLPTPFGDLSRGQVLSVLMLVGGGVMMFMCARRPVARQGGLVWFTPAVQAAGPTAGEAAREERAAGTSAAHAGGPSGKTKKRKRKRKR